MVAHTYAGDGGRWRNVPVERRWDDRLPHSFDVVVCWMASETLDEVCQALGGGFTPDAAEELVEHMRELGYDLPGRPAGLGWDRVCEASDRALWEPGDPGSDEEVASTNEWIEREL